MEPQKLKDIEEALKTDISDRHSFFQLRYFVVGKEPTLQSKLWRCLRELKARKDNIEAIKLEIEENSDQIELAKLDLEAIDNGYLSAFGMDNDLRISEPRKTIQKRQVNRKIGNLTNTLSLLKTRMKYAEEEAAFFIDTYTKLGGKEKLKTFDDPESQAEYWNTKLSQELEFKVLLGMPVDTELMKTIMALDDECPVKIHAVQSLQHRADSMRIQHQQSKEKLLVK